MKDRGFGLLNKIITLSKIVLKIQLSKNSENKNKSLSILFVSIMISLCSSLPPSLLPPSVVVIQLVLGMCCWLGVLLG